MILDEILSVNKDELRQMLYHIPKMSTMLEDSDSDSAVDSGHLKDSEITESHTKHVNDMVEKG